MFFSLDIDECIENTDGVLRFALMMLGASHVAVHKGMCWPQMTGIALVRSSKYIFIETIITKFLF